MTDQEWDGIKAMQNELTALRAAAGEMEKALVALTELAGRDVYPSPDRLHWDWETFANARAALTSYRALIEKKG